MTLESKGITNFVVLEAKDHIGGRSYTTNIMFEGESIPVDHGSMWIHGASSNPLSDIALEFDIDMATSTFNEKVYTANGGGAISDSQLATIYRNRYENGFMRYQANRQDSTDVDESLQTTANQYLNSFSGSNFEKDVLKYFMSSYIELDYSASMSDLSLWWWDSDLLIGPDEDFLLPNGYGPLIEAYAAPIRSKIITDSPVTEIDYRTNSVKVVVNGTDTILTTKKVIVTVPLGVLKSNSIRFRPALPWQRRRSINRIGMGSMNKIFMFWPQDQVFWQRNVEVYGDIVHRDTEFNFFNFQPYNGDRPFLAAFFLGETAKELEELYANDDPERYEEEIRDLAMEPLKNIFGSDIPLPQKVFVTKWNSDEYTQGSYSFNQVGMGRNDRKILGRPIRRKRMYLAGEATHPTYFQTTHGAYLSGRSAANKVYRALQQEA
jgi:monoamine oxidase